MGLFSKIKDILFEEEEIENEEVKTEYKKEKFQLPKKEIVKKEMPKEERKVEYQTIKEEKPKEVHERELYKSEPTFPFPLAFDEDVKIKTRSEKTLEKKEVKRKSVDIDKKYYDSLKEEPKRSSTPFKPSPVISPVYGILDKNYRKEDIQSKKTKNEKIDIDKVRKKAFGSLEQDIENSFISGTSEIKMENIENDKTIDDLLIDTISINLDQTNNEEKKVEKKEKSNPLDILDEIENGLDEINNQKENIEKEQLENDTLETDLFNLIDSMYDKKEGNE